MPGLEGSPEMLANWTPSNPGRSVHLTCSGVTTGKGTVCSARETSAGPRSTTPASDAITERALMLSSVLGKADGTDLRRARLGLPSSVRASERLGGLLQPDGPPVVDQAKQARHSAKGIWQVPALGAHIERQHGKRLDSARGSHAHRSDGHPGAAHPERRVARRVGTGPDGAGGGPDED